MKLLKFVQQNWIIYFTKKSLSASIEHCGFTNNEQILLKIF